MKGADGSRHTFVHSATAMASNGNVARSPSSSVLRGQYDTTYATIGPVSPKAFDDDTIMGDKREPVCIAYHRGALFRGWTWLFRNFENSQMHCLQAEASVLLSVLSQLVSCLVMPK